MTAVVNPDAQLGRPSLVWDTNTALAVIVGGAFLFLVLVGAGFKGFNVTASVSS